MEAARRIQVPAIVGTERPQALAGLNPAGHLALDFRDLAGATRSIVDLARRQPLAAVVAADDDGVLLAAEAAAALGLRHHSPEAVASARDKLKMRETLRSAGVTEPGFIALEAGEDPERLASGVRYPCVLKPVSWSASRGVMRANHPGEFVAAFRRLSGLLERLEARPDSTRAVPRILVEDYVAGPELALEGLVDGGRLRTLALFDKPDPLEGPFFEETLYVTPSRHDRVTQLAIRQAAQSVVSALGLAEGPVHAEFRIGPRGPVLVEIAPRSIGGLCSRALRFGDGVPLEELILLHALGRECGKLEREPCAAGVMMIPIPHAGTLRRVEGEERALAVPGIEDLRLTIPVGDEVIPLPEGSRYLGFLFARGGRPAQVEHSLRAAHQELRFEIAAADTEHPMTTPTTRMGPW
jgi:biotin carboxylase